MRRQDVALYVMSARLRLLYEDRCCPFCYVCYITPVLRRQDVAHSVMFVIIHLLFNVS